MISLRFKITSCSLLISILVLSGCAEKRWYKGNTHTHTVLCGHADSTPEAVTQWYHNRGYNFLTLSEHNIFIDPADVKMPKNKRDDFILIPGEEITGGEYAHSTALNTLGLVDPALREREGATKAEVIQDHVHGTREQHGQAILNHPNFNFSNSFSDIRPVVGLHMFELYNGHHNVHNFGDADHISVEALWDQLLTDGMLIYGVSSDDAHKFKTLGLDYSNPGRGWIMVRSKSLTPDAISEAMYYGDFYGTSGIILSQLESGLNGISLVVDELATAREIKSSFVRGHKVVDRDPGYLIEFIGDGGEVLSQTTNTSASMDISSESTYVRAKVTYTRKTAFEFENFYCWTQPVFTDGRRHDAH